MIRISFLLFFATILVLALGYSKGYFQNTNKLVPVKLKGVNITKKESSTFKFKTPGPGKLNIFLSKIDGRRELEDISVSLYQGLNKLKEGFYQGSKMTFPIKQSDFFSINFEVDKRYITVAIRVEFIPDDPSVLPEEDNQDVLTISQTFFGLKKNDTKEKLSTTIYLEEGDKVLVSTSDTEEFAEALMFEFDGDGYTPHQVIKGQPVVAPETKEYTFLFYLDEEASSFLNIDFLKSNKGARIEQVNVRKIKKGKPIEKPNQEPDPLLDFLKAQQQQQAQQQEFLAKMEADRRRADSLNNVKWKEDMKRIENMFNPRIDTTAQSIFNNDIRETIPPRGNLLASNRMCFDITDVPMGNLFWLYWIGIGDQQLEQYQNEETEKLKRYPRSISYLGYLGNLLFKRGGYNDPLRRTYQSGRSHDQTEYAIVDWDNRINFLKNRPYEPIFPYMKGENIAYTIGNSSIPNQENGVVYLCVCNKNYNTPVTIHFKYETFITQGFATMGMGVPMN